MWFFLTLPGFCFVLSFLEETLEIKCLLDIYIFFFFSNLLSLESKGKVIFFCIGCICVSQIKDTLFSCWDGFLMLRCHGSKGSEHPALDLNPRARSCDGPTPPPVTEASGGENLRALEVRSQLWKLRPPNACLCHFSEAQGRGQRSSGRCLLCTLERVPGQVS